MLDEGRPPAAGAYSGAVSPEGAALCVRTDADAFFKADLRVMVSL